MPQKAGLPSRASLPSIIARTPWPGSSIAPDTARARAPRARPPPPADGGSTGEPRGRFQQVGIDRGGIVDARLRQRQRSGLVEDDGVDLGEPLDGVAGVEDHAGAEQGAGRHDLHRRDRQRQARRGR